MPASDHNDRAGPARVHGSTNTAATTTAPSVVSTRRAMPARRPDTSEPTISPIATTTATAATDGTRVPTTASSSPSPSAGDHHRARTVSAARAPRSRKGASRIARTADCRIHGDTAYTSRPPHAPFDSAFQGTGTAAYTTRATNDARRLPSGRATRQAPHSPSGIGSRIATRRTKPNAPPKTEPTIARGARPPEGDWALPSPAGFHDPTHVRHTDERLTGGSAKAPTAGSDPKNSSRVPTASTTMTPMMPHDTTE